MLMSEKGGVQIFLPTFSRLIPADRLFVTVEEALTRIVPIGNPEIEIRFAIWHTIMTHHTIPEIIDVISRFRDDELLRMPMYRNPSSWFCGPFVSIFAFFGHEFRNRLLGVISERIFMRTLSVEILTYLFVVWFATEIEMYSVKKAPQILDNLPGVIRKFTNPDDLLKA
jgi:hypothetical protein